MAERMTATARDLEHAYFAGAFSGIALATIATFLGFAMGILR